MSSLRRIISVSMCAIALSGPSCVRAEGTWGGIAQDLMAISGNLVCALLRPIPATIALLPKVIRPVTREMVVVSEDIKDFVGAVARECPLATAAVVTAGLAYSGYKLYAWLQHHPHHARTVGLGRFFPAHADHAPIQNHRADIVQQGQRSVAVNIH